MQHWLGLAPDLCGSPVRPLTLRHVLELMLAGNAFFTGRRALLADVFDFLWRLHPAFYRPGSAHRYFDWPSRERLVRRVRGLDLLHAEREIHQFISAAYADHPGEESSEDGGTAPKLLVPHANLVDALVEWFAATYSWSPATTLDMPIAQLFQLRRQCGIRHGEDIIDPEHAEIQQLLKPTAR